MSGPTHEAPKRTPRSPRRWLRFSLRSLLIVMTLVCVGIEAKQRYDWHRRQQLIHSWIAPLVELARAADGDVTRYPDDTPHLTPPAGLPAEEQVPLLRWGVLELETPEERLAALKILVESHQFESLSVVRELIPECRHGELQATLLHLLSMERNPEDLPLFEKLLDSPSAVVRGAAAESIGYVKQPAYERDELARRYHRLRLGTIPPIDVSFASDVRVLTLLRSLRGNGKQAAAPTAETVPPRLREALETQMLRGKTLEERTAAARALVGWPPDNYSLRVAEWGVWIDDGEGHLTAKEVLDENPGFVHRAGNSLASLPGNGADEFMIILKPILHVTADRPLAVDVEISMTGGRPWYVFPRPDNVSVSSVLEWSIEPYPHPSDWEKMEPQDMPVLEDLADGYPWIHPDDRSTNVAKRGFPQQSATMAVAVRWQSLIVSPERQAWMTLPEVPDDPKFRWWEQLRDVPSAWVTSRGETERFLYYDGPTTARSPLEAMLEGTTLLLVGQDLFNTPQYRHALYS